MVKSPTERRLVKAVGLFSQELAELRQQVSLLTEEYLSNNPVFVTATSNVLLISIREHREEKLTALRNVALNAALPNDVNEDIQLMFITMVDDFTTWHLKLLTFFKGTWWNVLGYQGIDDKLDNKDVVERFQRQFPDIKDKSFLYKILNDLSKNQLLIFPELSFVERDYLVDTSSDEYTLKKLGLTKLGEQFVSSISYPEL